MLARLTLAILMSLIALIRGYYTMRFGLLPMNIRKPRAWYDWLAEIGAYSVAVIGSLYVLLGERMLLRFASDVLMRALGLLMLAVGVLTFAASHQALAQQWTWNIGLRDDHQ